MLAAALLVAGAVLCASGCSPRPLEDDGGVQGDAGAIVTCNDDEECGLGARCLQNICRTFECAAKTDCPAGEVCVEGACGAPPAECANSEECPGTLLCDGLAHSCFDPGATGCTTSGDCQLEPGCEEGCTCQSRVCTPLGGFPDAGTGGGDAGNAMGSLDLGGYVLENRENDPPQQATILPDGTTLSAGQVIVIARSASKSDFEAEWGPLPSAAKFLNANIEGSGVPIINGGERFAVRSPVGTLLDGPTIAGTTGMSYQRTDDGDADEPGSWTESADVDATPGTIEIASAHVGLVITEWSDLSGGGGYDFEFIELAYLP